MQQDCPDVILAEDAIQGTLLSSMVLHADCDCKYLSQAPGLRTDLQIDAMRNWTRFTKILADEVWEADLGKVCLSLFTHQKPCNFNVCHQCEASLLLWALEGTPLMVYVSCWAGLGCGLLR